MSDVNLDWSRDERQGMPEIVYGEGKSVEQLRRIIGQYQTRGSNLLITRLQEDKADELNPPPGSYSEISRTLTVYYAGKPKPRGQVAVVSAGTSDLPVVSEAAATLEFLGIEPKLFGDVGVAGIHRLQAVLPEIEKAQAVICVAGFEGALASVLGGLISRPVIGVPTSVGYGVAEGGHTALHAMLSSCANGLVVVNIDNGCGAALAACRFVNSLVME